MSKISELSDGGALQSTDYLIAVRSGGNVKVQPAGMTFSSATFTTADINGGTIDGVTIGGSSAGAGSFTTLTASGDVNVDSGTLFVDASANAVGIGTTSPITELQVGDYTGNQQIAIASGTASNSDILFGDGSTGNLSYRGVVRYNHADDSMQFWTSSTEAMRIDSSGNLLVGHTSILLPLSGSGLTLRPEGNIYAGSTGTPLWLNREDSDGEIVNFRKDGTTVGSIGTSGSALVIGNGNAGLYFNSSLSTVMPWGITGNTNRDAAIDIGQSANRFKDLYLSGGVYLGGTGAANKLEDYEEGTYTPEFDTGTFTYGNR